MKLIKNDNGFTLIEIMIAIVIIGILGVSFMGFFGNSAIFINKTETRKRALIIAQQEMERAKTKGYNNINNYKPNNDLYQDYYAGIDFEANLVVEDKSIDTTIPDGLKRKKIIVTWKDQSLELCSFIANGGGS